MTQGDILRNFIDNQKVSKKEIAEGLGMSRRNLYQLFESNVLEPSTIKKIEDYFGQVVISQGLLEGADVEIKTPAESYLAKRRAQKNANNPFLVPFFPIKAQAGYVRASDQEIFLDTLERYALPPGVDHHGATWRYWEIEGDSMESTFEEGDVILTSQINRMDWEDNLRNFYVYVIVTNDMVNIKRLAYHPDNKKELVMISDNEEHAQKKIRIEDIKELWVYRRTWATRAKPPRIFEINV